MQRIHREDNLNVDIPNSNFECAVLNVAEVIDTYK